MNTQINELFSLKLCDAVLLKLKNSPNNDSKMEEIFIDTFQSLISYQYDEMPVKKVCFLKFDFKINE